VTIRIGQAGHYFDDQNTGLIKALSDGLVRVVTTAGQM
jgi:hypothetical protein